jgi:hypothetical protein
MQTVQLIQISPDELSSIIADAVNKSLNKFLDEIKQSRKANPYRELMTRKEVADFFSVSLVTIHDWSNNGILKPCKLGGRTYYLYSEIVQTLYSSNKTTIL